MLNVNQAAGRLGTLVRFVRRLVHERRVAYTKLGQHVRIEEADIDVFIAAGRVEPRAVNGRPEQLAWLSTDWSLPGDEALARTGVGAIGFFSTPPHLTVATRQSSSTVRRRRTTAERWPPVSGPDAARVREPCRQFAAEQGSRTFRDH